ncbi:MAG: hypothetical protein MK185_06655 [Saccharospirillaceae bacterium]|nr:hypothetical protein [Saccharospirillaceae bacterium]
MTTSEVFRSVLIANSIPRPQMLEAYWYLEDLIAMEQGRPFTPKDFWSHESRKCGICGRFVDTTPFGEIPFVCVNSKCNQLKEFWNIHGDITAFRNHGGNNGNHIDKRSQFLRYRIGQSYSSSKLCEIPELERSSFLVRVMNDWVEKNG